MDVPTGILRPKVKGGRSRRRRRGGAAPTRFLGKFLAGVVPTEEAETKGTELDIDMSDPSAPSATGLLLETYGADKRAEVEEAVGVAKSMGLGDIQKKLEDWLKAHPAGGRRRKTRRRTAKKSRRTYK
jgi:hypothetical protein